MITKKTDPKHQPIASQPISPRMSSAMTLTGNYRPDIDGLRALSVLLVIGFHFFPRRVEAGFIGVDLFFVISGYLITRLILHDLEKAKFRIGEFWGRRIVRLFPSVICVLVSLILIGWFFFTAEEFKKLGKHIAASSLYIPNIVYWIESGYFDEDAIKKPLLHLWSLGVEEQFYIVWPLILVVGANFFGLNIMMIVVAVFLLSFGYNIYFSEQGGSFSYFMPFTRGWQLLAGAGIAALQHSARGEWLYQVNAWCQHTLQANLLTAAGLSIIVVSCSYARQQSVLSRLCCCITNAWCGAINIASEQVVAPEKLFIKPSHGRYRSYKLSTVSMALANSVGIYDTR
ncbi:MAG: acyltransferase [Pseudomonadota bacterium]